MASDGGIMGGNHAYRSPELGFDFTNKPEDKAPPKDRIAGAGGKCMLVRIGVPGGCEGPYVERDEKVDQDEVNWAWDTNHTYQENYLIAWKRITS